MTPTTIRSNLVSCVALRERLRYDLEAGVFTWRVACSNVAIGARAGHVKSTGYRAIRIDGRSYLEHRLAWLYVHGYWPDALIDHIDGNTLNNAIGNLRQATRSQNQHNRATDKDSASGLKGVSYSVKTRRWRSYIYAAGRQIHLGYFDAPEAAHKAYSSAAVRLRGEFARTS